MAYNSTTFPPPPKVCRIPISNHMSGQMQSSAYCSSDRVCQKSPLVPTDFDTWYISDAAATCTEILLHIQDRNVVHAITHVVCVCSMSWLPSCFKTRKQWPVQRDVVLVLCLFDLPRSCQSHPRSRNSLARQSALRQVKQLVWFVAFCKVSLLKSFFLCWVRH